MKTIFTRLSDVEAKPLGATGPTGPGGSSGGQGQTGVPGFTWRGNWLGIQGYAVGDAVQYLGTSYVCIAAISGGVSPNSDGVHWALLAAGGGIGLTGLTGPTGPAGATGASGPSGWTVLNKPTDETRINSANVIQDAALQFAMVSSTKYRIRGKIFFDTTAAGDMKYTFVGPAAPTLIRTNIIATVAGATPSEVAIGVAYPLSSGVALAGNGTTGGWISFDIIVHNGTNASTFAFAFAQNTATNDTGVIVRAGSYMEYAVV